MAKLVVSWMKNTLADRLTRSEWGWGKDEHFHGFFLFFSCGKLFFFRWVKKKQKTMKRFLWDLMIFFWVVPRDWDWERKSKNKLSWHEKKKLRGRLTNDHLIIWKWFRKNEQIKLKDGKSLKSLKSFFFCWTWS